MVKLDQIYRELLNIHHRLNDLEKMISSWNPQPLHISESELLTLPDNIRRTYLVVASEGGCSATRVSNFSGRSRAIESNYLNQLVRMGWLAKHRDSRTVEFRMIMKPAQNHGEMQTNLLTQTRAQSNINRNSADARTEAWE